MRLLQIALAPSDRPPDGIISLVDWTAMTDLVDPGDGMETSILMKGDVSMVNMDSTMGIALSPCKDIQYGDQMLAHSESVEFGQRVMDGMRVDALNSLTHGIGSPNTQTKSTSEGFALSFRDILAGKSKDLQQTKSIDELDVSGEERTSDGEGDMGKVVRIEETQFEVLSISDDVELHPNMMVGQRHDIQLEHNPNRVVRMEKGESS
ncbi:hypothetical protein V6N13_107002 [Hibiscus sabdariffa]